MNMSLRAKYRRRVLANSLVIASTVLSCTALRADQGDKDKSASQGAPGQYEHGEKGDRAGNKTQRFIKEAAMGGQMEIQMGQLGEQNAQNPEVKNLAATLVRDHTQANQKLQQLAQQKGITLAQSSDTKHQKHLDALRSKSGADFDKAFVTEAIKDHKKDIAKFEKCQKEEQDPELKAFIDQTLPTLRNHLQMAQNAARTLGVDANVAADIEETDTSAGAPAAGVSGSTTYDNSSKGGRLNEINNSNTPDKTDSGKSNSSDQSSLNNSSSSGTSAAGTIGTSSSSSEKPQSSTSSDQTSPSASIQGNVGDHSFSANAGVNSSDTSTSASTDTSARSDLNTDSNGNKVFHKNDGKVLGLSTDKHDGKFLGIIPDPRSSSRGSASTASSSSDVSSTTSSSSDTAIGGPATSSSGTSSSERVEWSSAPSQVKQALQAEGADTSTSLRKMTVYEANVNGKTIHVTEDGRIYKHDQTGSSTQNR